MVRVSSDSRLASNPCSPPKTNNKCLKILMVQEYRNKTAYLNSGSSPCVLILSPLSEVPIVKSYPSYEHMKEINRQLQYNILNVSCTQETCIMRNDIIELLMDKM